MHTNREEVFDWQHISPVSYTHLDVGYQKALDNQKAGNIKIIGHAAVAKGNLYYDHRDMAR